MVNIRAAAFVLISSADLCAKTNKTGKAGNGAHAPPRLPCLINSIFLLHAVEEQKNGHGQQIDAWRRRNSSPAE
ncbi:hypothetical protein HYU19_01605 [Candidatus Woesearchaeota archaeon]|nr:hypothetical protein [Candidatus Woesearchaeota archaeon]